jgi:hypothetical protein
MKRFTRFWAVVVWLWLPSALMASEGLDIPEALDKKVPLDGLGPIAMFFAKKYNENLLLYAVVCTVLMAVVGMVIAYGTDLILKAMGMEVHKIEHKE